MAVPTGDAQVKAKFARIWRASGVFPADSLGTGSGMVEVVLLDDIRC